MVLQTTRRRPTSKVVIHPCNKVKVGETKQYEGRYCQFCKKFNTGTSLSKHLHIHHQHEFKVGQKKFLPLASKIAHPDVPRGFAAMRSEAVGLDDFQFYLDPQLKV